MQVRQDDPADVCPANSERLEVLFERALALHKKGRSVACRQRVRQTGLDQSQLVTRFDEQHPRCHSDSVVLIWRQQRRPDWPRNLAEHRRAVHTKRATIQPAQPDPAELEWRQPGAVHRTTEPTILMPG